MESILTEFYAISIYQWLATLFSLIYIFFAVRNESICFVFGLISALFWAYESYFILNLKFDSFLQVFYVFMSIYGLYLWLKGGEGQTEKPIGFIGIQPNVRLSILGIILTCILFFATQNLFETEKAFIDLLTTVFSILATFLLVYRYVDNWIYWVVIDLVYMVLYWIQGGYLFTIVMLIYTTMAIIGFRKWNKLYLDTV